MKRQPQLKGKKPPQVVKKCKCKECKCKNKPLEVHGK
jgi:hypothetical protein